MICANQNISQLDRLSHSRITLIALILVVSGLSSAKVSIAQEFTLELRYQEPTSEDSGRYHRMLRDEVWSPEETAIIVCDMWDAHHCLNAVRRETQFAPILNDVLINARDRGITIIHSPSACMDAYKDHPARQRAINAPPSTLPAQINEWCHQIPSEERGKYPIDQSDGGEDDDPKEHAAWAKELEGRGLNPRAPWKKQIDLLTIDEEKDYISDQGNEVWNILESRGIKNVVLTGVHTNMCVLGRPFGLRQMAKNGKNVVLMRDLTDTMYNPGAWPYVSHFTGTDLIVSHIERHVCPTITSDQLLGGKAFRFEEDTRPNIAMLIAEDEYETETTLPEFAHKYLGKDFRVSYFFGSDSVRNEVPGLEQLVDADVLLISVRRRLLPAEDMKLVRDFIESGKAVIGIRTASHAFSLRNGDVPEGFEDWPEFDAQVFGGNYHGHHGNKLTSMVSLKSTDNVGASVLQTEIERKPFQQGGSLYQVSPLADRAVVVATAEIEGEPVEPVAWVFRREDGGTSFYTSLGHKDDFANPAFEQLLLNAIYVASGKSPRTDLVE